MGIERKYNMSSQDSVAFGILSTSSIVGKVLPGLKQSTSLSVLGVASRDPERAQLFCDTNDCGKGMSHEDMLSNPDIDALYAPLPSGLRNAYLTRAIAAGKHVYPEKPMGGSLRMWLNSQRSARHKGSSGWTVQCGTTRREQRPLRRLYELVISALYATSPLRLHLKHRTMLG